ncbi:hypothetical protein CGRA01v4_03488 [Colletotrichum graminicola]|nr:hypothetical protein CGRA01v4_03488 [Colletotrichum graminicola]
MSGSRQRKTQGPHSRTRRESPSSFLHCYLVYPVVERVSGLSGADGCLGTEALEWTPPGGRYHACPLVIRRASQERIPCGQSSRYRVMFDGPSFIRRTHPRGHRGEGWVVCHSEG